jgi:hypothetical protein
MYIKVQHTPIHNGFLANLNGDECKILIALASFVDKDGKCYPTQDQLADLTGLSRATVNRRIGTLCKVEFMGEPLLTKTQVRYGGTYTNNVYTINKGVIGIFE